MLYLNKLQAASAIARPRTVTVQAIGVKPPAPCPPASARPSVPEAQQQALARSTSGKPSIAEKLGGRDALVAAADVFYQRLLADPYVSGFFSSTDIAKQRAKQVKFLSYALGGAEQWRGKSMFEAHERLELDDSHFDVVAGHLNTTLESLGVPPPIVKETMAVVESTREQVLGRQQ